VAGGPFYTWARSLSAAFATAIMPRPHQPGNKHLTPGLCRISASSAVNASIRREFNSSVPSGIQSIRA
jgi:hypothetical protein